MQTAGHPSCFAEQAERSAVQLSVLEVAKHVDADRQYRNGGDHHGHQAALPGAEKAQACGRPRLAHLHLRKRPVPARFV